MFRRGLAMAVAAVALGAGLPAAVAAAPAGQGAGSRPAPTDWPAYLYNSRHSSYAATQKAITPASVPALRRKWQFTAGNGFLASPVVASGSVYIGANNGWFYQLSATTGRLLHKRFLGTVKVTSCPPPPTGIVATAALAVSGPSRTETVFVAGPDGYLYALNASNLSLRWKSVIGLPSATENDYYNWSSPTIANGRVYVGISSNCDTPLVRGGVLAFSQSTGKRQGSFYSVPTGKKGGSVWSSVAVDASGHVYATTGNGPLTTVSSQLLAHSEAIVKLSPTLKFLRQFQVPASDEGFDTDFGASPVIFDSYVGACDKNGVFYALRQATMKLAWKRQISGPAGNVAECIASPVWNGKHLFFGTSTATIGGVHDAGSVQERAPWGQLVWATGLPNGINGSPSGDAGGVIAAGTYDFSSTPDATYLINAGTGKILRTLTTGLDYSQSAFAGNWLFTANEHGVSAWGAGTFG
jgi:outer membrane protein assembly factor BamB